MPENLNSLGLPVSDSFLARFTINEKGADDIEEEGTSKKNVSKRCNKTQ